MKEEHHIYGLHAVIEAIKAGKEIDKILIQRGLSGALFNELRKVLQGTSIPYQLVPPEKINRITSKNHQGIVAFLCEIEYFKVEELLPQVFLEGKTPLVLVLDKITDVRNFGAIARTAACTGVNMIIVPQRGSAQINADAIKTSAGALHQLPVCREYNLKETLLYLKESGLQLVACHEKTQSLIYQADFKLPTALVMGAEDTGISPEYLKLCDKAVKIPMQGNISSLNVSVATGVVLYEAVKQRL
ncbi:MAG: 23S rRNA (guanosine(2251)-2'-O)-methyltransferase RlmB [Bacteroidetes bacterium]|nr:23S rRNA (guanosine(2251)-2'-O)-methyltransferase RlmB [Bacteroidota bacterium]